MINPPTIAGSPGILVSRNMNPYCEFLFAKPARARKSDMDAFPGKSGICRSGGASRCELNKKREKKRVKPHGPRHSGNPMAIGAILIP